MNPYAITPYAWRANWAKSALQFAAQPIQSIALNYGKELANEYILSKMPRPLKMRRPNMGRVYRNAVLNNRRRSTNRKMGFNFVHKGKFPFPHKRAKKDPSRVAYNGSQGTIEDNIAAVTGDQVAFIGFSSVIRSGASSGSRIYLGNPVFHCMVGILRKMFKKSFDVDLESLSQRISDLYLNLNIQGIRLYYKTTPLSTGSGGSSINPTVATNTNHDILFYTTPGATPTGARTFTEVCINLLTTILGNKEYGARTESFEGNITQLYGLSFTRYIGTTQQALDGMYIVENQKVRVRSTHTIHVQNQTTSDSDSLSTQVVDANPVKGRIYYFNDPNPIVRYSTSANDAGLSEPWRQYKLMNDANGDAIIYPDLDVSAEVGTTYHRPWSQLPGTDQFTNCKKYSAVSMAPGEMRHIKLTFKFNGYLLNLLKGMAINNNIVSGGTNPNTPAGSYQTNTHGVGNFGTCLLFAFDKRLSTGTGGVEIAVQRHTVTTATIGRRTRKAMEPAKWGEIVPLKDDTTAGG